VREVRKNWKRGAMVPVVLAVLLLLLYDSAAAQDWSWTKETVDTSGRSMSLAVDADGNAHISYGKDGELKYGFRPAGRESHWYTMKLGSGVSYTDIKVDEQGNAQICVTYLSLPLRFLHELAHGRNRSRRQNSGPVVLRHRNFARRKTQCFLVSNCA